MVNQMPGQRAKVLGVHALGGTLAEVGAPLCAGLLLAFMDWQSVLQLSVIPAFVMALLFLKFRRRVPVSRARSVTRTDLGDMVRIWMTRHGVRTVGIIVFYNMALMGAMAMMPLYLLEYHDLTPAQIGLVIAVVWSVGALAQPLLGHLSDVTGRKNITVIGLCFAAVFLAISSYAPNLIWVVIGFILSLGALVGIRAVLLAAMVDVSGSRESTTLGFAFAVMDGVGALGALFAGYAGKVDLHFAFLFASASAGVAIVLTLMHRFGDSGRAAQS